MYQPGKIHYDTELESILGSYQPQVVYCLNSDDAGEISKLGYSINTETLVDALTHCRLFKSDWELDQLRYASKITSEAHVKALEAIKSGIAEWSLKSAFEAHTTANGLLHQAYQGIYGTGINSAILHYTGKESVLKDGQLVLIDSGAEYLGYAADFTRTYPVSGKYTDIQAALYQTCLNAHNNAIEASKPGVKMEDLHLGASRDILKGLKGAGVVNGDIDEMMDANIFALFFPHGLGHFLGLDTHDVGGYPKGVDRIDRPGIQYLRARRTLEPRMVLTIEPGLYFIPALLKPALENPDQKKFLNEKVVTSLFDFGGIRIEDNLIITESGYENMTFVPKEIADIERIMS